ncbi:MAG: GntR family transcriptional regulator [Armatimonadota bacterium]
MLFRIDSKSSVPVYAQIIEQVKRAIASGILAKGDVLPSRREMALELEINPMTVLKAYKELETEGLVDIKQGSGCFVSSTPTYALDEYRLCTLSDTIDRLIEDASSFGILPVELERMVRERIESADWTDDTGEQCA